MDRINLYIDKDQLTYIKSLPGNTSEHIRRAIDQYIVKMKNQDATVSPSSKEGGKNA